jgi:peptidyl-prolyl cis-trans isomerase D
MSADAAKLPAYVGLPVGDAGYMLVRISKVIEGNPKEQRPDEVLQRSAGVAGGAQYQAYIASLRQQADIEVNQPALERK